MPRMPRRSRFFHFPHNDLLFDAQLDAIREEPNGRGKDIVIDFQALDLLSAPAPHILDGRPHEAVEGEYRPLRLRFRRAVWVARTGPYADLAAIPDDEDSRRLFGLLHMREAETGEIFWLSTGATAEAQFVLRARDYALEERDGPRRRRHVVRRWAMVPPPPAAAVPRRPMLYRRYAGDPITIHLNGRLYRHRLFIGGLHHQRDERPGVDHVLNLCGIENDWAVNAGRHPDDRFSCRGEMAAGMDVAELLEEAEWVVERLRAGKRVLVHCYAGMNRSATVCCAALILLEGIGAEAALARVRERHPNAWPDPYHWLLLRWLADHRDEAAALAAAAAASELAAAAATATLLRP
jgi:Dual specificity phosphatase, catalytic domain